MKLPPHRLQSPVLRKLPHLPHFIVTLPLCLCSLFYLSVSSPSLYPRLLSFLRRGITRSGAIPLPTKEVLAQYL